MLECVLCWRQEFFGVIRLLINCLLDVEMWPLHSKVKADEHQQAGVRLSRLNTFISPTQRSLSVFMGTIMAISFNF